MEKIFYQTQEKIRRKLEYPPNKFWNLKTHILNLKTQNILDSMFDQVNVRDVNFMVINAIREHYKPE